MKKSILAIIFCFLWANQTFAQNNAQGMRFLTINAMMQYGQKLYDRGEYNEATAVFNHVLDYDDHQVQALDYLKKMGHEPIAPVPILVPQAFNNVDMTDTASLKEAIEVQKKVIEKLRNQINAIKANIATQSQDS